MNDKNPKSSSGKFRKWFKRKHKKKQPDPCYLQDELSGFTFMLVLVLFFFYEFFLFFFFSLLDMFLADGDDFKEDIYVSSFEIDPCTSTNELR